MTDDEDKTLTRRMAKFMAEGLSHAQAEDLAGRMFDRDRDPMDDRRVCFECTHYKDKLCHKILDKAKKPTMQLRFVLQRCDHFDLKGKRTKEQS